MSYSQGLLPLVKCHQARPTCIQQPSGQSLYFGPIFVGLLVKYVGKLRIQHERSIDKNPLSYWDCNFGESAHVSGVELSSFLHRDQLRLRCLKEVLRLHHRSCATI